MADNVGPETSEPKAILTWTTLPPRRTANVVTSAEGSKERSRAEPMILVTFCCAECHNRREILIPSGNADIFERALLECVPDQWTKIANGHFTCDRHRRALVGRLASVALSDTADVADSPQKQLRRLVKPTQR